MTVVYDNGKPIAMFKNRCDAILFLWAIAEFWEQTYPVKVSPDKTRVTISMLTGESVYELK